MPPTPTIKTNGTTSIFDPNCAPIIIIRIGAHRLVLVPRSEGSATSLGATAIESKPNNTSLNNIIASSVAGAASAPSGEIQFAAPTASIPTIWTATLADETADLKALGVSAGTLIVINADKDSKHGTLISVMDNAGKAGAERFAFATQT